MRFKKCTEIMLIFDDPFHVLQKTVFGDACQCTADSCPNQCSELTLPIAHFNGSASSWDVNSQKKILVSYYRYKYCIIAISIVFVFVEAIFIF